MDIYSKNCRKITVAEMAPHIHSFKSNENKVHKILTWLTNWIELSLSCGKIKPNDFLPNKADLACHIGVSQGTIQNVFRLLEDAGVVESKQRIGTYIKNSNKDINLKKLTSKREMAIEVVKKYLIDNGYKEGDLLISTRNLAKILGISNTTIRLAITHLVSIGIISKQHNNFVIKNTNFSILSIQQKTLVDKVVEDLRDYIYQEFKQGSKLPSNQKLAKMFGVSLKTIHDAIKVLAKEGLLCARRGRYGTIIMNETNTEKMSYFYEKVEMKIRQFIEENCSVGEKLPSIKELAITYETSEKTIKKALDNLAEDGYLTFVRGRYGGTFIMDIPQNSKDAYKWLAINTDYVSN